MVNQHISKDTINRLEKLERNEEGWFVLWSEMVELKGGRLFTHHEFLDDPLFNHVTGLNVKAKDIDVFIENILTEFRRRSVLQPAFYVSTLSRPRNTGKILESKGFRLYDLMYIMSLKSRVKSSSRKSNHQLVIEPVNKETIKIWAQVYARAFDIEGNALPTIIKCSQNALTSKSANLYIGYVKKEPVAVGALYSQDRLSGIYCLGTLESLRGQGIANTMLSRLIDDSFSLGSKDVCLQTLHNDGVKEFYLKRGFSIDLTRKIYTIGIE